MPGCINSSPADKEIHIWELRRTSFRVTKIKTHKNPTNIKCMIYSNFGSRVREERRDIVYVSRCGKNQVGSRVRRRKP